MSLLTSFRLANLSGEKSGIPRTNSGSGHSSYVNSQFDPSLEWTDLKWLKGVTKLPIIVKGILTEEDAILAVEAGASAIIVSNHGGRQLDGVPATVCNFPNMLLE